jgi:hypothetical protein
LIFESTGKAVKRHGGVQREFARLVKSNISLTNLLPSRMELSPCPPTAGPC